MHDQLISDSEQRLSLFESAAFQRVKTAKWTREEIQSGLKFVVSHADFKSYHLLFALSEISRDSFKLIPSRTKARILVSALEQLRSLIDWGYLEPNESFDDSAARELISTGLYAIPCLIPLLDNTSSAPLFGSEDAKLSLLYKYRRCDFAYRYIRRIQRRMAGFKSDPTERDMDIAKLKQDLAAKSGREHAATLNAADHVYDRAHFAQSIS